MRKPNPILLDILVRAGAYPFDDFDVDGHESGVWVIPNLKSDLLLVIAIVNNGTIVDPLVRELRRIAQSTLLHHGFAAPLQNPTYRWTYQVTYQCTETIGRVLDRDIRIRSEEELALMLNSYAFIPWFEPDGTYHGTQVFDGGNLPELIVRSVEEAAEQKYSDSSASSPFQRWDKKRADAAQTDLDNEFGVPSSISYEELKRAGGAPDFGFEQSEDFDEDDEDEDFVEEGDEDEIAEGFVEAFEEDEGDNEDDGDTVAPPSPPSKEEPAPADEKLDEENQAGTEQESGGKAPGAE
jgi:hypothetical protein